MHGVVRVKLYWLAGAGAFAEQETVRALCVSCAFQALACVAVRVVLMSPLLALLFRDFNHAGGLSVFSIMARANASTDAVESP